MNVFDFVNAINFTKKDIIQEAVQPAEAEKEYVPFLTNRALSYFPETIHYCQEMNKNNHLDNRLQFDYLRESVRKGKRFAKWHKKEKNTSIDAVMQCYNCSRAVAEQYLKILDHEQVDNIKTLLSAGGIKPKNNK